MSRAKANSASAAAFTLRAIKKLCIKRKIGKGAVPLVGKLGLNPLATPGRTPIPVKADSTVFLLHRSANILLEIVEVCIQAMREINHSFFPRSSVSIWHWLR